MAADRGDVPSMYNLGRYYQKKRDYTNMKKYYSMAIKDGSKEAIVQSNVYLLDNRDIDYLFKCYDYLSVTNRQRVANLLSLYTEIHDSLKKHALLDTDITKQEECNICNETKYMVKLDCDHIICVDCFNKISVCPFCRRDI